MIPEEGAFIPQTVLVVAPPTDQTGLVREALAQAGYSVITREDCTAARTEVENGVPDLLVLDNGVQDCSEGWAPLLQINEKRKNQWIPVLVLLTKENDGEDERGLSAYADDILVHPVRRLELLRRVRSLLRVKGLQSEIDSYTQELEEQSGALRQLDRMKADFIAVISHELRTPLTPVVAYLEMLLDGRLGPLAPQQQEALEIIRTKTQHLHGLIEDLLTFASTDRERSRLREEALSLDNVLKAEVDAATPRCIRKGIALVRAWPANLPQVQGDAQQLR